MTGNGMGVHLRHHEGNLRIHAECARVVDHHSAGLHRLWSELEAALCTCRKECDVHTFERIPGQSPYYQLLAVKLDPLALGTLRGERNELGNREVAFLKDLDHFPANGAGRADNGNYVFIFFLEHFHLT